MKKARLLSYLLLGFITILSSCSKDDDGPNASSPSFYDGALSGASEAQLKGVWAIFKAGFEGVIVDIPIDYQSCGRDFFVYSDNGLYSEYLMQNSDCEYYTNQLNWVLDNGIIRLSNDFGQSEDLVITTLNQTELTFRSKFDVDEDGELDLLILYCKKYVPQDIDFVSNTFNRNYDEAFENLLSFTWNGYQGFNDFSRYEVYRSVGENCSYQNAELIATITDATVTEFTDLTPPGEERLCYYLKTYTNQGLLGQSYLVSVDTSNLYATPVNLYQPSVQNNQIEISWETSNMPYFSHYEIAVSNFPGNVSASAQQVYTVAEIYDINMTTFIDENPPYLENPYYMIYVYDIFGNKTYSQNQEVTTYWEVNYKRDEIIGLKSIQSYAIDPDEPVIYFYGRESGEGYTTNIHRFNYETNQTEAISNVSPDTSTSISIKVFNTASNGKELIIEQGSELHVYDALTLNYKYALEPQAVPNVNDFILHSSGFWILTDGDDIFTYNRDNANFYLIDSNPHFTEHQGSYNYQVFELNDNKLLVGHNNEANSMIYNLNTSGSVALEQTVPIPIKDAGNNQSVYNAIQEYIVNFEQNRMYSTSSYSFLESFEQPYYPSGISEDGNYIFGSNNDPDWQITSESLHAKEAIVLNRQTQAIETIETIGYPHIIFENFNGDIISISSGFKKDNIGQQINDRADVFMEQINLP